MTGNDVETLATEAVIFDLDGVLVSTDEFHYQSWQRLADEEGIAFDREFNERFRGVSRMQCLAMLLENTDKNYDEEEKQELADRKNGYYRAMIQDITSEDMLPGAAGTLDGLDRRNIKIAVASGSKNAPFIVERIDISDKIQALVSGLDITRSKPDPQVFLMAAERLSIAPEKCVVVEDARTGVEAARNAGMRVLGIASEPFEKADRTVESLAKISVEQLLSL
ncbi:MAG: beta-phosphoglucomutase [Candidatus Brocadiia bacterium]